MIECEPLFKMTSTLNDPGPSGKFQKLDKSLLKIDRKNYQRSQTRPHALGIARRFEWVFFGVIIVARRKNGEYWVIEGAHRVESARMRSDIRDIPCYVFDGLNSREEARIFGGMNRKRKNLKAFEDFRADLHAENKDTIAINNIFKENNVEFGKTCTATTIIPGAFCYSLFRKGKLALAMQFIHDVWPDEDKRNTSSIVTGVATFIIDVLPKSAAKDTPLSEVKKLFQRHALMQLYQNSSIYNISKNRSDSFVQAMKDAWNKGRSTNKID